ncbi:6-phosphogluconolactonase [Glaciecola sp. 1036]|uniref:6-phosphogluconolactonase n=1 Tax=Alteromonadaceae TaxID=72275 RepID=UPI003CFE870D
MSQIDTAFTKQQKDDNIWLSQTNNSPFNLVDHGVTPITLNTEADVGQAMLDELLKTAEEKSGDINIALLGGRGAQQLHKLLGKLATTNQLDALFSRLNVFTQDALAPMSMDNCFSFVRDFERILGPDFFNKIKSFTPMQTDTPNLEAGLMKYLQKLSSLGGLDIFFLGHGPEQNQASHLAYIKPFSGASYHHLAGLIPISDSILAHHISKFKAGGSQVNEVDEKECRNAQFILTLGPAAILQATKIVQSVVDADSAPAKVETYAKVLSTPLSHDEQEALSQLDANPGLWVRLHPNVKSFVLPNLGCDKR